jgi:hypothetical protein
MNKTRRSTVTNEEEQAIIDRYLRKKNHEDDMDCTEYSAMSSRRMAWSMLLGATPMFTLAAITEERMEFWPTRVIISLLIFLILLSFAAVFFSVSRRAFKRLAELKEEENNGSEV